MTERGFRILLYDLAATGFRVCFKALNNVFRVQVCVLLLQRGVRD